MRKMGGNWEKIRGKFAWRARRADVISISLGLNPPPCVCVRPGTLSALVTPAAVPRMLPLALWLPLGGVESSICGLASPGPPLQATA